MRYRPTMRTAIPAAAMGLAAGCRGDGRAVGGAIGGVDVTASPAGAPGVLSLAHARLPVPQNASGQRAVSRPARGFTVATRVIASHGMPPRHDLPHPARTSPELANQRKPCRRQIVWILS